MRPIGLESLFACALLLAVGFAFAPGAAAAEPSVFGPQQAPDVLVKDAWTGVGDAGLFAIDDAFVFADPQRGAGLEPDAHAAAVRGDRDRLAAASDAGRFAPAQGRVAAAFDGFVSVGADGLAYAAVNIVRGEAVAARLRREAADIGRVAMTGSVR